GTLSPGNSIGTISVQGSLTLASAATYMVEASARGADHTNVTGTATLGGTLQVTFMSVGSAHTYNILSAAGGLHGTFGAFTTAGLPAGFTASLSYTATDAILAVTANLGGGGSGGTGSSGALSGLNQNQAAVAGALNTFFNNGGALPPNFVNVFGLTGG